MWVMYVDYGLTSEGLKGGLLQVGGRVLNMHL